MSCGELEIRTVRSNAPVPEVCHGESGGEMIDSAVTVPKPNDHK